MEKTSKTTKNPSKTEGAENGLDSVGASAVARGLDNTPPADGVA